MTWFGWLVVAYWSANALGSVALIGRKREPITPGVAIGLIVVYALLIWGLIAVGADA
jgi:hypothetical protein